MPGASSPRSTAPSPSTTTRSGCSTLCEPWANASRYSFVLTKVDYFVSVGLGCTDKALQVLEDVARRIRVRVDLRQRSSSSGRDRAQVRRPSHRFRRCRERGTGGTDATLGTASQRTSDTFASCTGRRFDRLGCYQSMPPKRTELPSRPPPLLSLRFLNHSVDPSSGGPTQCRLPSRGPQEPAEKPRSPSERFR